MPSTDVYLFSPLSVQSVKDGKYSSLLLHFLLVEIFRSLGANEAAFSSRPCFFPYDWTCSVAPLNKFAEHMQLLPHAFPNMKKECKQIIKAYEKIVAKIKRSLSSDEILEILQNLFAHLEPFLLACKDDERLEFFLGQHHKSIERLCAKTILSSSKTR